MPRQFSGNKELLDWVRLTLAAGDLSYRPSLADALGESELNLQDVLHVLETASDVSTGDFALGTHTIRGRTADSVVVAVVIAERSDRNRVKIVNAWRE